MNSDSYLKKPAGWLNNTSDESALVEIIENDFFRVPLDVLELKVQVFCEDRGLQPRDIHKSILESVRLAADKALEDRVITSIESQYFWDFVEHFLITDKDIPANLRKVFT